MRLSFETKQEFIDYWLKHLNMGDIAEYDVWNDGILRYDIIKSFNEFSVTFANNSVGWNDILDIKTKENDPEYFL